MKSKICFFLACLLLLTGCSLEASAGVSTSPTESAQVAEPSGSAENTVPMNPDNGAELLALLPQLPFEAVYNDLSGSFDLPSAGLEEIRAYADALYAAGFTENMVKLDYSNNVDCLYLWAMNEAGAVVELSCQSIPKLGGGEYSDGYLSILPPIPDLPLSGRIQENTEEWNDHEYRVMVPAPSTKYWRGAMGGGENGAHYSVYMEGMDHDALTAYAKELQQAGFDQKAGDRFQLNTSYEFSAYNTEGWWVWLLTLDYSTDTGWSTALFIAKPGIDSYNDWGDASPCALIPEPAVNWYREDFLNTMAVQLNDMDYQMALNYMQAAEEMLRDEEDEKLLGPPDIKLDETGESLFYAFQFQEQMGDKLYMTWTVLLTYDASRDVPCQMVVSSHVPAFNSIYFQPS